MTLASRFVSLGVLAAAALAVAAGCDDKSATKSSGGSASAPAEPLPAGLMVEKAPDNARDVADVRTSAGDGEEVVVRGRVGGSEKPFVEGRAAFTLVDLAVATCDKAGSMHNCPTPWDYCCDDPKDLVAKSVTVQVVGPAGQPLRASLEGASGLKPMSEVAVKGKVKKSPDGKAIVVNATELFVKQG
jgi:hypothetical protein